MGAVLTLAPARPREKGALTASWPPGFTAVPAALRQPAASPGLGAAAGARAALSAPLTPLAPLHRQRGRRGERRRGQPAGAVGRLPSAPRRPLPSSAQAAAAAASPRRAFTAVSGQGGGATLLARFARTPLPARQRHRRVKRAGPHRQAGGAGQGQAAPPQPRGAASAERSGGGGERVGVSGLPRREASLAAFPEHLQCQDQG